MKEATFSLAEANFAAGDFKYGFICCVKKAVITMIFFLC